jgi:DNA-binding MarR family transcriptional regulator
MPKPPPRPTTAQTIAAQCVAMRLKKLHRVVAALYDDALRPHGLRGGQLGLLVAVSCMGEARPTDLCRALRMDKSTLSRDADVLRRRGWLETADGPGRSRPLRLTPAGRAVLERAAPAWRSAQDRAVQLLGPDGVQALHRMNAALRQPPDDST